MESEKFKFFDFSQEKVRVLHYTWIAFFLTFFVWFNMAPLKTAMVDAFTFLDMKNYVLSKVGGQFLEDGSGELQESK